LAHFAKLELIGFSDINWGDVDEQKSTNAFVFTFNNTPIT
jgi:hypothetical protein